MYKIVIIFVILLARISFIQGQQNNILPQAIKWYSLEEAQKLVKENPKKILIDFYTEWCGPCKMMFKNTYSNPVIINYINNNFYPVKFNAEGSDTVLFKDSTYYNNGYDKEKTGRNSTHSLTYILSNLNNSIKYPSTTFLDENLNVLTVVQGVIAPNEFLSILIFFAEDVYKNIDFNAFNKNYINTFDTIPEIQKINWVSFEKALEIQKSEKKKILLYLYGEWNYSSKIMFNTTFSNQFISDYINKNFICVNFNSISQDTLKYKDKIFINENKGHPFHQFPVFLLQGVMKMPSSVLFDEEGNIITPIPGYFDPINYEVILNFFGGNIYKDKNTSWTQFKKDFSGFVK